MRSQGFWLTVISQSLVGLWAKTFPPIFGSPHDIHYLKDNFTFFCLPFINFSLYYYFLRKCYFLPFPSLIVLSISKNNKPGLVNLKVRIDGVLGQSCSGVSFPSSTHRDKTKDRIPGLFPAGQKRSRSAGKIHVQAGK